MDFGFVAMFLLAYFCGSHIFVENLLESEKTLNQKMQNLIHIDKFFVKHFLQGLLALQRGFC